MNLTKLQAFARKYGRSAIRKAVENGSLWISADEEKRLFERSWIEGGNACFDLCMLPENAVPDSSDAYLIAHVVVDRNTGRLVQDCVIHLPPLFIPDTQAAENDAEEEDRA